MKAKMLGLTYSSLYLCLVALEFWFAIANHWIITLGVFSLIQYQLFNIAHNCAHGYFSCIRLADQYIGEFAMFLRIENYQKYRREHFKHHRSLKNRDLDPGEKQYIEWGLYTDTTMTPRYILFVQPLKIILRGWQIKQMSTIYLAIWLLLLLIIHNYIIIMWLISLITLQFILYYWSEVSDHYQTTTRNSTKGIFWIYRIILGLFDGYHWIHHNYPHIPWFQIPEKVRGMKDIRGVGIADLLKIIK